MVEVALFALSFRGEPQNFFMISAALCLCLILCHTCWGVITFAAIDDRKYHLIAFAWGSHFLLSCLVKSSNSNLK